MGDEPLLPLNTHKYAKVQATTAQTPVATADRRQRETIAEIWPEISFREKEKWLGILLDQLRRHFKNRLAVKLVRYEEDIRFQLEDSTTQTTHSLTLAQVCQILENHADDNGQLVNQEC